MNHLSQLDSFPRDFLWGASTASHQVEGDTHNDWSEWEKKNAVALAKQAEKRYQKQLSPKVWERIKDQATNPKNYISGKATDHYQLYTRDFDLMQSLGINAYRFSLEWSRIEPEEGVFDEAALEHYKRYVHELRRRNIEPFLTLWHWTSPLWLIQKGGWSSSRLPFYFARYAQKVADYLGENVTFWITLNEPQVYTTMAHHPESPPPSTRNPLKILRIRRNLIKAHIEAYKAIKKLSHSAQIGIANNTIDFEAAKAWIPVFTGMTEGLKKIADWWWNFYFLDGIRDHQDFIGVNYYFHSEVGFPKSPPDQDIKSDLGWSLHPKGLYQVLIDLKKYQKPLYITEHGLADSEEHYREWYLKESLQFVNKARQEGADIRGYFHWSLLDNFEWTHGFWPRFGLIGIDYTTQERHVRPSAWEYAKFIKGECD